MKRCFSLLVTAWLMWPAVVSAGGWYLLVPHLVPVKPNHESPEAGALPSEVAWEYNLDLRAWNQTAAFDSAYACEQEKQRSSSVVAAALSNVNARAAEWTPEQARRGGVGRLALRDEMIRVATSARAWELALCVSTDDPRLK